MVHLSCDYDDSHFKPICEPKQKPHKRKNRGFIQLFNEVHSNYPNHTIGIYSRSETPHLLILHPKPPHIWM